MRRIKCTRTSTPIVHRLSADMNTSDDKHYTIIDSGADTGMKGDKTSLVLEHTQGKVNVSTGFYDRNVTYMNEDLPIGTYATKVMDQNGYSVDDPCVLGPI